MGWKGARPRPSLNTGLGPRARAPDRQNPGISWQWGRVPAVLKAMSVGFSAYFSFIVLQFLTYSYNVLPFFSTYFLVQIPLGVSRPIFVGSNQQLGGFSPPGKQRRSRAVGLDRSQLWRLCCGDPRLAQGLPAMGRSWERGDSTPWYVVTCCYVGKWDENGHGPTF